MVKGCDFHQHCVLEKQHEDELTCYVRGIRPIVTLEWRVIQQDEHIHLKNHQMTVVERDDVYDISSTVTIEMSYTTYAKVTVECAIAGSNAEHFNVSTTADLLFPMGE